LKWGFDSIRALAIRELLPLASPVDRVVLSRQYDIDDWLPDALTALCQRADPLSAEEAEHMSKEDILRIFQAREQARSSSTTVDLDLAKEAVTRRFALRTETPAARNVSPTNTPVRLTVDDALNICSATKTGGFDEEDIQKLSAYVAGPNIGAVSLHRVVVELTWGVLKQWEPRFKLCCILRSSISESLEGRVGRNKQLKRGRALFDHIIQIQCHKLLSPWSHVDSTEQRKVPSHQLELARFVARVAEEGWVGEETLDLCRNYLEGLNNESGATSATRLCSLLSVLGKALDQRAYREFIEKIFERLQRLVNDRDYVSVQKDIYVSFLI
jgi:hypothetical protein